MYKIAVETVNGMSIKSSARFRSLTRATTIDKTAPRGLSQKKGQSEKTGPFGFVLTSCIRIAHPAVTATIPGARNEQQENASGADITLPPEDLRVTDLFGRSVLQPYQATTTVLFAFSFRIPPDKCFCPENSSRYKPHKFTPYCFLSNQER